MQWRLWDTETWGTEAHAHRIYEDSVQPRWHDACRLGFAGPAKVGRRGSTVVGYRDVGTEALACRAYS